MSTRARQSTAPPAGTQRRAGTELPPYEPPSFPLNPAAQRAIAQLAHTHSLKKLDDSLGEAHSALSVAAGEINDRLTSKGIATEKRRKQDEQQGTQQDAETEDNIEQSLNELRDKVERMTQRMDESMRKIIDGQHSVQSIKDSIAHTATDTRANASTQASTQQAPTQRRRRPGVEVDDDEDEEDEDFEPTNPAAATQAQPTPIETFRSKIEDAKPRYQSYSLATRYADNNDYRDFRRVVHDAKHPSGDVPLAHHSEWFEEGNAPAPGVTTRARSNPDEEDHDDIAISRATISTKCPLTLQEFKNPLTSSKCPHSFEADAIRSLLQSSVNREGGRPTGQRIVQCPVPGCSQWLSPNDLNTDNVLIRQIKRIQRARELEQEEADEDEGRGGGRGTQNGATVIEDGDEDGADVDDIVKGRSTQMKAEPKSSVHPASTVPRGTAAVVDLGTSDEDEDEDEEDEDDEDTMEE